MLLSDDISTAFPPAPMTSFAGMGALQEIYGLAALAANAKRVARKAAITAAVSSGQTKAQAVKTVNVATRTANQAARAANQLAKKAGVPPPVATPAQTPTPTPGATSTAPPTNDPNASAPLQYPPQQQPPPYQGGSGGGGGGYAPPMQGGGDPSQYQYQPQLLHSRQ